MLVALTSTWTVQQGGAYWVGPVWGYDGVDSSDDYTFDERKRVQDDDSSMTYMKRKHGLNSERKPTTAP